MKRALNSRGIANPNVVIMRGLVGSEIRIDGFKAGMASVAEDWRVAYAEGFHGHYSKQGAFDSFEPYLVERIAAHSPIHGVFATNDEMALGVREALLKHRLEYASTFAPRVGCMTSFPVVVGFDGIRDLTLLIDHDDDLVIDTVDVQLTKQIQELTRIVTAALFDQLKSLPSEGPDGRYVQMECQSYREKAGKAP